jgi:hypothetical protein
MENRVKNYSRGCEGHYRGPLVDKELVVREYSEDLEISQKRREKGFDARLCIPDQVEILHMTQETREDARKRLGDIRHDN